MKTQIHNLKDYAELAQAAYFYFEFIDKRNIFELNSKKEKIKDENYPREYKEIKINLEHAISQKYQEQKVLINLEKGNDIFTKMKNESNEALNLDKLNGEFSELQAKNFSQRYEVKFHQPNTASGFSATLFYDKEKGKFVVGFRGTETDIDEIEEILMDLVQDIALSLDGNLQSSALLDFLKQVDKIIKNENKNIVFVGHSLGGYLAQMAFIYCDKKHKDKLSFSPSEVYTFNAPSIYGWNSPNVIVNPNTIKIMRDILGKYTIDISEKITHIYDNGYIELIASAQYGANNALGIYTGENDHSIKSLVTTLYFYTYLLELKENENKIIKNNSLKESLENLNHFMKNIEIYTKTFITKNHKINKNVSKNNYEALNSFEFFLSQIAFIMQENENYTDENYSSIYQSSIIKQDEIIDFILKAQEKEYYILILHQNDFDKYRKDCSFINQKDNLAYKIALGEFRIFIIVDKDLKCLEKIDNIHKIYGYNSKAYHIINQIWDELYLGGVCKISQALYFNGKAKVDIA
ncbi:lipase family protein [Campylobacter helveticus]|nr:Mbeg1-like protein [Campylobacter helveticus]